MKKIKLGLLVLLSMAIITAAVSSCNILPSISNGASGSDGESDTTSDSPNQGFEIYENEDLGFKIEYPIEWMYIDGSISEEEFGSMITDVFGSETADLFDSLGADASNTVVSWYDFENASDVFVPNANITVSDAGGITQNDLKSPSNLKDLQDTLEYYYPQMFSDFESVGNMTGKALGGNYFAIYKYNYGMDMIDYYVSGSGYQAITVKDDMLYTFTVTTHEEKLDEATYEKILLTLEF